MEEFKTSSDFFKKWQIERKIETEEKLQKWCVENNIAYIQEGLQGREQLEEAFNTWASEELKKKAEEELQKAEEEKKWKLAEKVREFERKIPPRYKNANINQLKMTNITQKIIDGASAVIVGTNGFGKTNLIYALAREWVSRGETVEIISAQELLYNIKTQDNGLYDYIKRKYKTAVDHLMIDEIDKIFESKADHVYLNYLVNMRYEWLLQTIIIGNGNIQELKTSIGNSIVDRLTKEGGVSIDCSGSDRDWRLTNEKEEEKEQENGK